MSCPNCQCSNCQQIKYQMEMQVRAAQAQLSNNFEAAQRAQMAFVTCVNQAQLNGAQFQQQLKTVSYQEWNQMMADLEELKETIKKLKGE